jgi:hypothetical protein
MFVTHLLPQVLLLLQVTLFVCRVVSPHLTLNAQFTLLPWITHTCSNCSLFSGRLHAHTAPVPTRLPCLFFPCLLLIWCMSILKAWCHQTCGKPCWKEQQRHVTISLSLFNSGLSLRPHSQNCISFQFLVTGSADHWWVCRRRILHNTSNFTRNSGISQL